VYKRWLEQRLKRENKDEEKRLEHVKHINNVRVSCPRRSAEMVTMRSPQCWCVCYGGLCPVARLPPCLPL
jgi:hypothetical protein